MTRRFHCPSCGNEHTHKASRVQRSTIPNAGPYALLRACSRCGTVFESPWAAWQIWFCLVCSCILTVAVPILMVLVWVGQGFQANTVMALVISVSIGATILLEARRQRRFRHEWLAGQR